MIVALTSIALPVLFIGGGLFAMAALSVTWRAYAGEFRELRAQLKAAEDGREFAVWLMTTEARTFWAPPHRREIRRQAAFRRRQRHALRAAA